MGDGPHTLTELTEQGHVAPASMSQSVNRLTSADYAIHTPDPNDRRGDRPRLRATQQHRWLPARGATAKAVRAGASKLALVTYSRHVVKMVAMAMDRRETTVYLDEDILRARDADFDGIPGIQVVRV